MHKDESGHRTAGLVQDDLVGGSVKGLTGEGNSFRRMFPVAVVGAISVASKN